MTGAAVFTAVMVALLLVAEARGSRAGIWVAKPLAAAGFVAAALLAGAAATTWGRLLLGALVLCAAGDLLLIPRGRGAAFLAGLGAFLAGHLAFAAAFAARGLAPLPAAAGVAAAATAGLGVLRWLGPHLPPRMTWPVRAYVAAIALMVGTAIGATAAGAPLRVAAGGVVFMASDLFVARQRFVAPGLVNRLAGLPLYFGAQLLLATAAGS